MSASEESTPAPPVTPVTPAGAASPVTPAGAASPASPAAGASPAGAATPAAPVGKPEIYRSPLALVIWWVWVVFAVVNLVDLAVQGHDQFAVVVAAVLILITGVTYVGAFRPRVLADDAELRILNPLRNHQLPWGSVNGVDLGDSLRVRCSWQEVGGLKSKTLYGWAVHSPRRSRLKADIRARRSDQKPRRSAIYGRSAGYGRSASYGRPAGYGQLPQQAREALGKTDAEHIAAMLEQRVAKAHAAGSVAGPPVSSWHWPSVAALVLPAVLVMVAALV